MGHLVLKGLTKSFGGLVAVDNVDLEVNHGEIVSIIGPNGAGKTTIFNMLTGIYTVDSGTISFDDKYIHNCSPQVIVESGIARTFQNIRLFPKMRVIENVLVGNHINIKYSTLDLLLRTKKFKEAEVKAVQKALHILSFMGLEDQIHNYAQNLSYGMQRRLEIARAIATDANLLILDEPAAGMNPHESAELMELMKQLQQKGFTILLIEHDMGVVMNVSDRIYVLDYGKKIAEGSPREVANNRDVLKAYLGSGGRK